MPRCRRAPSWRRKNHVDLLLAVGGGSVSDCCKVVSAQAKLDEDIWEMQYTKHTYPSEFIPLGTIVTVSGTGSEMNSAQISLAWMLYKKPCIVPIPGTRRLSRLLENAGAVDVTLSAKEISAIDEELDGMEMSEVFGGSKIVSK